MNFKIPELGFLNNLEMPFSWQRPSCVEFPLIYLKFRALALNGKNEVNYTIEDLQRDRFGEVLEIMKDKHLIDEPMYSSKGVRDDPDSFQEMIDNWTNMLEQGISLVCFEEGSSEIVAVNILAVVVREAEFDAPTQVRKYSRRKQFLRKSF